MIKMSTDWTLPDVPKIQAQPPKPFPASIQDLISGITKQNLNYGSNPLLQAELHNTKQQLAQGLNQGLNFGVPQIAELQKQELINRQNQAPQIATAEPIGQVQQPIQPTTPQIIPAQKQSFFNSPTGRGILATILGTVSGQGLLPSIGTGVAVGFGRKQNLDNDAMYRKVYPELNDYQGTLNKDTITPYMEAVKYKREAHTTDLNNALTEQKIYEAMLNNENLPEKLKLDLEIKRQEAAYKVEQLMKLKTENQYLPQEKELGLKKDQATLDNTLFSTQKEKTLLPYTIKEKIHNANKPYHTGSAKLQEDPQYKTALSSYLSMPSGTAKKQARVQFLSTFGVDPETKIKQTRGSFVNSGDTSATNQKEMTDAKGNRALVEVDAKGNPIRVIKEL